MTKLYFHSASSTLTNLPTASQSGTTSDKNVDAQTVNRTMNPRKGASQTSLVLSSLADTASDDYYFAKFVSEPLRGITSISANTWNYAFACAENNANANFPNGTSNSSTPTVCYVWRPSTQTKVGNIVDVVNSGTTFSEPSAVNTETSEFGTFSGASVAGVQDDDVIVFEFWARTTQGTATARNDTFYYDGTTETNATGTTVSNHASYIETPQALRFLTLVAIAETAVSITDTLARRLSGTAPSVNSIKTTLTLDSTSGVHDQSFSGFGFTPKCALFWGVPTTDTAYAEGAAAFYGFTDGTTSSAISVSRQDNVSTTETASMIRNDACISLMDATSSHTEIVRGTLKTFDSDGLTITWNAKTNTTQYIIHCMAFGGSSISNVKVAQTTIGSAGTGNKSTTATGFKPDFLMFINAGNIATNSVVSSSVAGSYNLGYCTSSTSTWASTIGEIDANNPVNGNETVVVGSTVNCLIHWLNGGVVTAAAKHVSMDSDGYTLNWTTNPASTMPYAYLAVKGGLWDVGTTTQPTSAGNRTIIPKWIATPVLFGINEVEVTATDNPTTATTQNVSKMTVNVGGSDGTNEGCILAGRTYQTSATNQVMISLTSKVIRMVLPNATATSTTTSSEADATLSSSGITLNYTTADATARLIGWFALSKSAASGPTLYLRTIAETAITVSDSIYRRLFAFRRIPEGSVVVVDTVSRARATKKRYVAETALTTTDVINLLKKAIRRIDESVTVGADSIYRRKFAFRKITNEIVVVTDSIYRRLFTFRKIAEPVLTTTDTVSRARALKKRYISEGGISTTDSIYRRLLAFRRLNETTLVTDLLSKIANKKRYIGETALTTTDTVSRARALKKRYISEPAISITDSCARILKAFRYLAETVTVTDRLSKLAIKKRYLSDSLSTTDFVTRFKKAIRRIDDSVTITDSVVGARTGAILRAIHEAAITVSDTVTKVAIRRRYITESVNTTDSVTGNKVAHAFIALITETAITVSDTVAKQARKLRYLNESVSNSDTISRFKKARRTINESVTGTDSIYRRLFAYRRINETTNVTDRLSKQATKKRYVREGSITTTDVIAVAHIIIIKIVDTVCTSASTGGASISRAVHRIFGQNRASGF